MTEREKALDLKIAYVGGGSRGWAWGLMSDLASETELGGTVFLYDIDYAAAKNNEIIGNSIARDNPGKNNFRYIACERIEDALTDADFVVISILPGTFDEMESDVHTPEQYGIYQPVGDSTGPGGIVRALRIIPMYEKIALAIQKFCPNAWVINYTNPMTICVRTLYRVFPDIKAFGCCHEVFSLQNTLKNICKTEYQEESIQRNDIKVNVLGVNHFTWVTHASYKENDLFPVFRKYCKDRLAFVDTRQDIDWENEIFYNWDKVKADLFMRYNVIAAAGDRHLSEFCPGNWYLKNPEKIHAWGFNLTTVGWRKKELEQRLHTSKQYLNGQKKFVIKKTGEEGVLQMKSLLGLGDLVTNVNMPNRGQISNLPIGAVVETNAHFTADRLMPVTAGNVPANVLTLVAPVVANQECVVEAGLTRDLSLAFTAFVRDSLNTLSLDDSKELYRKMIRNTASYLDMYDLKSF